MAPVDIRVCCSKDAFDQATPAHDDVRSHRAGGAHIMRNYASMQSHSFLAVLFRIFLWFLSLNFQFLEMLASEQTKDAPLGWREGGSTGLGVYWFNPVDHILLAMPNQRTASCCHDVL